MATAARLVIEKGTDFSMQFTVSDGGGDVIDLNGYTAAFTFRKHWSSSTYYVVDATVTDPSNGVLTLSANNETTSSYLPGRFNFDVEITSGTGIKSRALQGTITVTPEYTY